LRGVLPVEFISGFSDRLVGALLIGIGLWRCAKHCKSTRTITPTAATATSTSTSTAKASSPTMPCPSSHPCRVRIGTLHGFAGSSHFLAIIPALALPTTALVITYLACYGIGTILAMMIFSSTIGTVATRYAGAVKIYRGFMFTCSAVAISSAASGSPASDFDSAILPLYFHAVQIQPTKSLPAQRI